MFDLLIAAKPKGACNAYLSGSPGSGMVRAVAGGAAEMY